LTRERSSTYRLKSYGAVNDGFRPHAAPGAGGLLGVQLEEKRDYVEGGAKVEKDGGCRRPGRQLDVDDASVGEGQVLLEAGRRREELVEHAYEGDERRLLALLGAVTSSARRWILDRFHGG
jgi:hypothetical protein